MAHIHLVLGPVGAGKSTFARKLAKETTAVRFALDEWMVRLFSPDRPDSGNVMPWYVERASRCFEQIWDTATKCLEANTDVILEVGLLQAERRAQFYRRLEGSGHSFSVYVLDAPRDVRRERVERRNHERGETFSMIVSPEIFEMASDFWEPPSDQECRERNVQVMLGALGPLDF